MAFRRNSSETPETPPQPVLPDPPVVPSNVDDIIDERIAEALEDFEGGNLTPEQAQAISDNTAAIAELSMNGGGLTPEQAQAIFDNTDRSTTNETDIDNARGLVQGSSLLVTTVTESSAASQSNTANIANAVGLVDQSPNANTPLFNRVTGLEESVANFESGNLTPEQAQTISDNATNIDNLERLVAGTSQAVTTISGTIAQVTQIRNRLGFTLLNRDIDSLEELSEENETAIEQLENLEGTSDIVTAVNENSEIVSSFEPNASNTGRVMLRVRNSTGGTYGTEGQDYIDELHFGTNLNRTQDTLIINFNHLRFSQVELDFSREQEWLFEGLFYLSSSFPNAIDRVARLDGRIAIRSTGIAPQFFDIIRPFSLVIPTNDSRTLFNLRFTVRIPAQPVPLPPGFRLDYRLVMRQNTPATDGNTTVNGLDIIFRDVTVVAGDDDNFA